MTNLTLIQSHIELIRAIIGILSTTVLTIIAILGLHTWKSQLKGKTEYELARRLLRSIYKVRNAISNVRNPFASSAEISTSLTEADIDIKPIDRDFHEKSQSALYQRRWKNVQDTMSEFDLEAFEAEVIWGDDVTRKIDDFRSLVSSLHFYIEIYLRNLSKPFRGNYGSRLLEEAQEVIYDFDNLKKIEEVDRKESNDDEYEDQKTNEYTQNMIKSIYDLEEYLREKIDI